MIDLLLDFLSSAYLWTKALHIMSVISWMAGIFYLPRLFVHHAERVTTGSEADPLLCMMEEKLYRVIMGPAMHATWIFGLLMVFTPGVIAWSDFWPWVKAVCVIGMTIFHVWLGRRLKDFALGQNLLGGRTYRIMNEVPTLLMIVIVLAVIVRPF